MKRDGTKNTGLYIFTKNNYIPPPLNLKCFISSLFSPYIIPSLFPYLFLSLSPFLFHFHYFYPFLLSLFVLTSFFLYFPSFFGWRKPIFLPFFKLGGKCKNIYPCKNREGRKERQKLRERKQDREEWMKQGQEEWKENIRWFFCTYLMSL